MTKQNKQFVVLSQHKSNFHPPFGIILYETNNKKEANRIFDKYTETDEMVILLDSKSHEIIRKKGNIEGMKIALDKNFPNWHK